LAWKQELPALEPRIERALYLARGFLTHQQRRDGSWTPLWFGNQWNEHDENPVYGTARVVMALSELGYGNSLNNGVGWLARTQRPDGSWGSISGEQPTVEETAIAVEALALSVDEMSFSEWGETVEETMLHGAEWLLARVESGEWMQPSPIGFYFAKLWYYEKLYPIIFTAGALNRVAALRTTI
jgi:squalene-hopene/tetraprenyl-beta-curcumene cyclase